jgi:hypothetical protein
LDRTWDWRFVLESGNFSRQRPTYDFFGVKYYFDRRGDQGAMGKLLTPVTMADLEVYRSETAWPRAFFANRVLPYDDVKAVARLIQAGAKPFAAVTRRDADAAGLNPILSNDVAQQVVAPARAYKLTQNSTSFVVDASGPGLAVLHETYVPRDFQAEINGKPAPVVRINHAFKGVFLPTAGTYTVRFTYWPEHMTLALSVAAFAALLWALACFLAPRLPSAWLDPRAQTAAHA